MLSKEHVEIIRSMKRRLDTMENDGDMFGQGFNHAIDRVCKLLEAEPPSGAESGEEKDVREWAMWFSINHLPNADLKTVSERAGYITQALLASHPAESAPGRELWDAIDALPMVDGRVELGAVQKILLASRPAEAAEAAEAERDKAQAEVNLLIDKGRELATKVDKAEGEVRALRKQIEVDAQEIRVLCVKKDISPADLTPHEEYAVKIAKQSDIIFDALVEVETLKRTLNKALNAISDTLRG